MTKFGDRKKKNGTGKFSKLCKHGHSMKKTTKPSDPLHHHHHQHQAAPLRPAPSNRNKKSQKPKGGKKQQILNVRLFAEYSKK